jgi:hypothetical protein
VTVAQFAVLVNDPQSCRVLIKSECEYDQQRLAAVRGAPDESWKCHKKQRNTDNSSRPFATPDARKQ